LRRRRGIIHNVFVGLLVFLASLTFVATALAGWTHQTVLVTDRFVGVITTATESPQVADSLGERLADQVILRLGLQQRLQNLLPDNLDRLAQPVTEALHDRIAAATTNLLSSPTFQDRVSGALTRLHAGVLNIINGDAQYFTTTNGKLTFDLLAVMDAVITELQSDGVLPTVADFPKFAAFNNRTDFLDKLGAFTQSQLPPDFGQIPIADASSIQAIGDAMRIFDQAIFAAGVLSLVLAVAALLFADRRWNAVFWLGMTTEVLLGLLILGLLGVQAYSSSVVANADDPVLIGALVGSLASSLAQWLAVIFVAALVITVPAWFMARHSRTSSPANTPSTAKPSVGTASAA